MSIIKENIDKLIDSSKYRIEIHEILDSTNKYAKEAAKRGAPEGRVIIAKTQSDGYGRMNRNFHSPKGSGLYMSIILRPKIPPKDALKITTTAAVAVSLSIEKLSGKSTGIKWVNDVFIEKRKVCGILTEGGFSSGEYLDYAILGIGVNLYTPTEGFPKEIADIAGGIYNCKPEDNTINILCADIINNFDHFYGNKNYLDIYRNKSVVTGKAVTVVRGDESFKATAEEIDDDLRLIVKDKNNNRIALESGEISIRL